MSARCPSRNQPLYEWPKERGDKKFICGGTNCEVTLQPFFLFVTKFSVSGTRFSCVSIFCA